jgi:deazaflavin-dependent oxidoreductase (nitroreductase family)
MVPGRRATLRAVAGRLRSNVYLAIGEVLTHPRFHPVHRRLYRWTGGRGPVSRALGMDMILVTARGRRSGTERTVPLAAVRDRGAWIVVGSNAGKTRAPAWIDNLRAEPAVRVEHRGSTGSYQAREAVGDELERLWTLVIEAYPGFGVYRDRTTRLIPVFVLDPMVGD